MRTLSRFAIVLAIGVLCSHASAVELAKDSMAVADIVIDAEPPNPAVKFAGQELQLWTEKISGAKLPIVSESDNARTQIILGTPDTSEAIKSIEKKYAHDLAKMKGNDGFAIRTEGNTVYIFARIPKGVLNGVFRLLELNSDIIFVRPQNAENGFGTIYSKNPNLSVEKSDCVEIPALTYIRSLGEGNRLWQTRLRNLIMIQEIPQQKTRQKWEYLAPAWTTSKAIPRQPGIGKTHPEYFAIRDGKRQEGHWSQLCYSNKDLVEYYCKLAEDTMKNTPDDVVDLRMAHADNHRVCQCEDCLKPITLPNGTVVNPDDPAFRSTAFWLLNNKAAERLGDKYPGRYLRGFAYVWSDSPPPFKLSENLMVMFAPYVKSHKVPIYHKDNDPFGAKAKGWMAQHENIYVYEYYLCTSTPSFYNPVADIAVLDLRFYTKGGVDGMYQDSGGGSRAMDASAIEYWVLSRLYWDPQLDPDALRDEFCRRAYRKAEKPMREFYRTIQKVWHKDPIPSHWNDNPTMSTRQYIVKNNLQEPLRQLLVQAEGLAEHPGSKDLVKRKRAVFERWLRLEAEATQKVELTVPYRKKVSMDNFDFNSGVWKDAAVIDDFRVRNSLNKPAPVPTVVKIVNDHENIYFAITCFKEDKALLERLKGLKEKPDDVWSNPPYIELFIDGDQREKSGYYHLAFNAIGTKYDARGRDAEYSNDTWQVNNQVVDDTWKVILKWPLESFGRNITMNNRFGMMIYRRTGNASWLGINVHDPAGFNDLKLNMN